MKTLIGLFVGAVLLLIGLYTAPMITMWWQTQRADVEIADVQKSYESTVKDADSVMAQEIKQAHAERDGKVMGAQNIRDVSLHEIAAKYPRAKIPRQVAIADHAR